MNRRRMMMHRTGASPVLPAEYQQCEWVGLSNNVAPRFIHISDTILTKADLADYVFSFTMGNISDNYIAGGNAVGIVCGTSTNAGCYFASQHGLLGMGYDTIGQYSSAPKRDYEMRWTATGGTVYSGGDVIATRNFTNMTGDQQFLIGSSLGSNVSKAFECYGAKIAYQNTVVANLIPCYRKSDGVIGFYDVVGNLFRSSEIGVFNAKGADI